MQYAQETIELFDEKGNVVGAKQRKEVDEQQDIVKAVFCFLLTPAQELVLSQIRQEGRQKGLYSGQWGVSAASLVRHLESPQAAMERVLQDEYQIVDSNPQLIGDGFYNFSDGTRRLGSVFYLLYPGPLDRFNREKISAIRTVSRLQLEDELVNAQHFAIPFLNLWTRYQSSLPF